MPGRLYFNWVRLAPNGKNVELFTVNFQSICTEKPDLKKSHNCLVPFGAYVTQFRARANPEISDRHCHGFIYSVSHDTSVKNINLPIQKRCTRLINKFVWVASLNHAGMYSYYAINLSWILNVLRLYLLFITFYRRDMEISCMIELQICLVIWDCFLSAL